MLCNIYGLCANFEFWWIFFYFLYILTYPRIRILGEMAYPRIAVSRTGIRIRVSGQHRRAVRILKMLMMLGAVDKSK